MRNNNGFFIGGKGHRSNRTSGGEQRHGSNAKMNPRLYLLHHTKDVRPKGLFCGEGKRTNASFSGNGKRPNASSGGEGERSIASYVAEGKRPNTLSTRKWKHGCNIKHGRAEHLTHQDKVESSMGLFQGEQEDDPTPKNR